jgi:acetolactate synthase-1/2/3 large subunit
MITYGGLGTMGYGLPAAIGEKVALPEALVIDIDGDASLNMTISKLLTASQFGIDVKVVLLNNKIKWLLNTSGPALLEVKVAPKALSLPMVPSGRGWMNFNSTMND